jgi:hypothetical protein
MRRSKSRRRFHTARVALNRRRRARNFPHVEGELPLGRYESHDPHLGCGLVRCHLCKWAKLDPSRRARSRREWANWEDEYRPPAPNQPQLEEEPGGKSSLASSFSSQGAMVSM